MDRRQAMVALGAGGMALLAGAGREGRSDAAEPPSATPAVPATPPSPMPSSAARPPGAHGVAPLPFTPGKLRGLSEKMMVSHHDNNYAAAVKNLNKVEVELSRVNRDTPGFVLGGLKQSELTFTNSMLLHESYFGALGGDGKRGAAVERRLAAAFGSAARWEEQFRALGASLGGGSGWAVLYVGLHDGLHDGRHDGSLGNSWSGNHTQALAGGVPLLVMDMYEHAYQMDFGAQAARYIDAFFDNIEWGEVQRRMETAEAMRRLLHR